MRNLKDKSGKGRYLITRMDKEDILYLYKLYEDGNDLSAIMKLFDISDTSLNRLINKEGWSAKQRKIWDYDNMPTIKRRPPPPRKKVEKKVKKEVTEVIRGGSKYTAPADDPANWVDKKPVEEVPTTLGAVLTGERKEEVQKLDAAIPKEVETIDLGSTVAIEDYAKMSRSIWDNFPDAAESEVEIITLNKDAFQKQFDDTLVAMQLFIDEMKKLATLTQLR